MTKKDLQSEKEMENEKEVTRGAIIEKSKCVSDMMKEVGKESEKCATGAKMKEQSCLVNEGEREIKTMPMVLL